MHTIQGPLNVKVGDTDSYNVLPNDALGYIWTVVGGNLVNGQGLDTISIDWTTIGPCSVSVNVQLSGGGSELVVIDPNGG